MTFVLVSSFQFKIRFYNKAHILRSKSFIGMITDINIEHKIYTNYIYI